MATRLLAFDTSTEVMAVSVLCERGLFAQDAAGGARTSAQLLPTIERQLERAALTLHALDAIAFGRGPGAFTGLRAACAVAQGLGFALAKPLLPLDSLLVVAEDAFEAEAGLYAVAMDARMDEIYGALYRRDGRGWQAAMPPGLHALPAWQARLAALREPLAGAAGSAIAAFAGRIAWPEAMPLVRHEHNRAAALMRLAEQAWAAGQGVDAAQALPVYLRDKVALTSLERSALRKAGSRA
jgi:tRNA threonylcarbamoyladenosine biosynthesis protein TsaB